MKKIIQFFSCALILLAIASACSKETFEPTPTPEPTPKPTPSTTTKKVGYLAYESFDQKSVDKLIQVCTEFRSQGVEELILDLRYNGGGYVTTEEMLASMLVPEANLKAGDVYLTEVYNDILTEAWGKNDKNFGKTFFNTEFEVDGKKKSTSGANIGISKIYALVSGDTASASEGLLVGLSSYMDIEIIGAQTHGKFCSGVILQPKEIYNDPPTNIDNWGIYVMINAFADKNGNNAARPNGLTPSVKVSDAPYDGYALGDENETMLKVALQHAGKSYTTTKSLLSAANATDLGLPGFEKMSNLHPKKFGLRIADLPQTELRDGGSTQITEEIKEATQMAQDVLDTYYLWNKEISNLTATKLNPETCTDPVKTVEEIRYKDDRWSKLYEDVSVMTNYVEGTEKIIGANYMAGRFADTEKYFLIVTYVYANSPAANAGIKRGDVVLKYNGADITMDNVNDAFYGEKTGTYGMGHMEVQDSKNVVVDDNVEITLSPAEVSEDPILCYKVFEFDRP